MSIFNLIQTITRKISTLNAEGPPSLPTQVNTDLASLFECPVCFEFVLPPILQCQSEHFACGSCRLKLFCCLTCRAALRNIRNLAVEKIASTVTFPCKYSSTGCTAHLLLADMDDHEKVCDFRPHECPLQESFCKWHGSLEQVMPHFRSDHKHVEFKQLEEVLF